MVALVWCMMLAFCVNKCEYIKFEIFQMQIKSINFWSFKNMHDDSSCVFDVGQKTSVR